MIICGCCSDYMDRFLEEAEGNVPVTPNIPLPVNWRENRSSSPSVHSLLYGRPPGGGGGASCITTVLERQLQSSSTTNTGTTTITTTSTGTLPNTNANIKNIYNNNSITEKVSTNTKEAQHRQPIVNGSTNNNSRIVPTLTSTAVNVLNNPQLTSNNSLSDRLSAVESSIQQRLSGNNSGNSNINKSSDNSSKSPTPMDVDLSITHSTMRSASQSLGVDVGLSKAEAATAVV